MQEKCVIREQSCVHVSLGLLIWRRCLSWRMVSMSMKESLIFRTSKACSPHAESGPWLVHKRGFDRMRVFLPRRKFCETSPFLVQMGFSANNVCVCNLPVYVLMVSLLCPQCCTLRLEATSMIGSKNICKVFGVFPVRTGTVSRGASILELKSIVWAPIFCAFDRNR